MGVVVAIVLLTLDRHVLLDDENRVPQRQTGVQVIVSARSRQSCEIVPQDACVNRLELGDLRHRHAFIHLVHGLVRPRPNSTTGQ